MNYGEMFLKKTLQYLLKPLTFAPAILVMVMIFWFSSQDGTDSSSQSLLVTERIVHCINYRMAMNWTPVQQAYYVMQLEHLVRKLAHFGEYALLGFCLVLPLYAYHIRKGWLLLTAQMICSLYAGLDEFHQSFSPGRTPAPRDVMIDSAGALTGILIGWLIAHVAAKTIFRPLSLERERRIRKEYYERQENRPGNATSNARRGAMIETTTLTEAQRRERKEFEEFKRHRR